MSDQDQNETAPELTSEDERLLDLAWKKIRKENQREEQEQAWLTNPPRESR